MCICIIIGIKGWYIIFEYLWKANTVLSIILCRNILVLLLLTNILLNKVPNIICENVCYFEGYGQLPFKDVFGKIAFNKLNTESSTNAIIDAIWD